ncbi:SPOR domain-containing protein [Hydrogenophaga sp.]|uniref:SPOR domain-containing protein n=1 Tax=Hydrogenophaga sp. TaxID=1904254 RepID=UPI00271DB279|nr:SPOR domain-containing protein [Hydrogenophaga sp.]MDO8904438.1 SPOR domain-containing protein [Hydrogenophaga sp.]
MPASPPLEDHSTIRLAQAAASNPTAALYRAALGSVSTQRYLALFERFDAAGRASLVWNPAAGLCTLNWMAFRGLWGAALVYLAAAEGLAILTFGLGRHLQWPTGVEIGVLGSLLMLSILVPGLYGNALLHADIRRRMASAVTDAHTVSEACEALERQAPTQRRLKAFLLGNALLGVLLLAVGAFIWASEPPGADAPTAKETGQVQDQVTVPVAPVPPATVGAPLKAESNPPGTPASPVAPVEAQPSAVPVSEPPVERPAVPPLPEQTLTAAPAESPPAVLSAPVPKPLPPPRAAAPASEPRPASPPPPILVKPAPPVSHGINVGLFAEETNAIKVHAQLIEAGLPATMQTVEGTRGPRTRVRAGPFPDRASADAAAQRIRAMGLEAQIYRQ